MRATACTLWIVFALAAGAAGCTDSMTADVPELEQDETAAPDRPSQSGLTDRVGGAPKRTVDRAKAAAKALESKGARGDEQVESATQ